MDSNTLLDLIVEVKQGTDFLPPRHDSNNSAFYVVVKVAAQKRKTKVVKNSFTPVWNETMIFDYDPNNSPKTIEFIVRHQEKRILFGKSYSFDLGTFTITLPSKFTEKNQLGEQWYKFNDSAGSAVLVKILPPKARKSTLKSKRTISITSMNNETSIFDLVQKNDYLVIKEWLAQATPEEVNVIEQKTGNTLLHAVCLDCKNLDERIIKEFLHYPGIEVHVPNTDGNTALHFFCAKWELPDLNPLDEMLKLGAQVNYANSNMETAIFKAISNGSIRTLLMVKLIEHGARMDLVNSFGESVLHYAVRFNREDLVNLILENCPIVNIKGKEGKTPLQIAVEYNRKGIAKRLKKVFELFDWMEKYNLGEHKGTFLRNGISKNILPDLTSDMLLGMNIAPSKIPEILEAAKKSQSLELESEDNESDLSRTDSFFNELLAVSGNVENHFLDDKDLEYLKRLGSGTSGDVYKGLYKGKQVAIKVFKEMSEEQKRDEFIKEYKIMCVVKHQNLVEFYGASFSPKLCMVMEYCARGSLYHVLTDLSLDLSLELIFKFMKETVAGVNALHSNQPQILHRDLKSLNLLITVDWHVKVADFGLSRFDSPEALMTLKEIRGTLAYTAPECYEETKYTVKNDIYSVGIIFWELVNRYIKGRYEIPYAEYKFQFDFQILFMAAKENLRPTINENVPKELADIIRICVDAENKKRPDCPQLLEMIDHAYSVYKSKKDEWDMLANVAAVKKT